MSFNRKEQRVKRHLRIRRRIAGTAQKPRMSICITNKHMYVQFIDDDAGGGERFQPHAAFSASLIFSALAITSSSVPTI